MRDPERPNPAREEAIAQVMSMFYNVDDYTGENLPPLKEEVISGVLRLGHTMQITAKSKSGKSWMLAGLAVALANGGMWMGHDCRRCNVAYFDTEIDKDSLFKRFDDVKRRTGYTERTDNLHLCPLRGKVPDINEVAAAVETVMGSGDAFDVVVLDSLYSFETGDENSVGDMRSLMSALNRISACGCSVIWSHHHAKGAAGARDVVDRGAGSGIFGRAPDAIVDLTDIAIKPDSEEEAYLAEHFEGRRVLPLRVSYVLREFPDPGQQSVVFDWPLFVRCPMLDACPERGSAAAYAQAGNAANVAKNVDRRADRDDAIADALMRCARDGVLPTRANVYERLPTDCSESTFRNWTKRGDSRTSYYADEDNMIIHE
ncbi:hypothetical protein DW090_01415 [Olsenella sp. AM05-17]|jgi:hypothetical protein|uniref:AAA family ATPase n=1 Tax=unclassified Olsenella TaxID=2638792 RepID=UPI000E4790B2|nr:MULTISPECIES: AAA family ATPase [unclassified Olsenella]RHJ96148.1 hypothetical protein DW092_00705 [Olsenella sp. AM05-7]RHK00418.1 hypothetical protein DW090_01415 [Olsenella sp. AM05-17]